MADSVDSVELDEMLAEIGLQASPLELIAIRCLATVAIDSLATAAARASAARTLLEYAGALGPGKAQKTAENKPLSEMSLAEIDRELAG